MNFLASMFLLLALLLPVSATAGQQCNAKPLTPDAVRKGLLLALETRDWLDRSGAIVALVGRVGSDLSEHGLRYSHIGIVQRDHPRGRWLVTHLLNNCGSPSSSLFVEGLGNFYLDDPFAYETIVVVPTPAAQRKLLGALSSGLPATLHTAGYSMIANPYSTRYQNSNQWVLEMVAASLAPAGTAATRASVQQWLKNSGYTASQIRIGPLKRIGARLFAVNVRFDDHQAEAMQDGHYPVVSVESVVRFFPAIDPGARSQKIVLD
jgi:hypothetical protein